jgi:NAD(P)H-hydrate epimerase
MKLVTPEQMRAIDGCAITEYGIPGIVLMEHAADAVAAEAAAMLHGSMGVSAAGGTGGSPGGEAAGCAASAAPRADGRQCCAGGCVLLLAGSGNNGGDAFAAARLLRGRGAEVQVYLLGGRSVVSGDARINLNILDKMGIPVTELNGTEIPDRFRRDMEKARIIIDGIFGTGLSRPVSGLAAEVINLVNGSGKPVLAIDIPSGVDGGDGSIKGTCIHATATVTFCLPKTGLVLHPGCGHAGRLVVADIAIPSCVIDKQNIQADYADAAFVSKWIPKRAENSNKGDYGRALLVTGSTGMTGSGCLAARAALRTGAGLVYAGVPASLAPIYGSALTEPIVLPLEDRGSGVLSAECAEQILSQMKRMNVAAVGPGLTASGGVREIVKKIIRESSIPLVLDADALNVLADNTAVLKELAVPAVLTPHPGEMARLTGLSIADVQADRIGTAKRFAAEYNVVVVLKGSRTVIALPDGSIYVNPTGNSGMASAGTGDVLTGIITGLIAQGADVAGAAVAGVFLHGLAGDCAAEGLGRHGMLAGDVVDSLPQAIRSLL